MEPNKRCRTGRIWRYLWGTGESGSFLCNWKLKEYDVSTRPSPSVQAHGITAPSPQQPNTIIFSRKSAGLAPALFLCLKTHLNSQKNGPPNISMRNQKEHIYELDKEKAFAPPDCRHAGCQYGKTFFTAFWSIRLFALCHRPFNMRIGCAQNACRASWPAQMALAGTSP